MHRSSSHATPPAAKPLATSTPSRRRLAPNGIIVPVTAAWCPASALMDRLRVPRGLTRTRWLVLLVKLMRYLAPQTTSGKSHLLVVASPSSAAEMGTNAVVGTPFGIHVDASAAQWRTGSNTNVPPKVMAPALLFLLKISSCWSLCRWYSSRIDPFSCVVACLCPHRHCRHTHWHDDGESLAT